VGFSREQFSRENVPEMTGGQSALLGGRACPEVAFLRELREIASRFGKGSCLMCVLRFSGVFCVSAENGECA